MARQRKKRRAAGRAQPAAPRGLLRELGSLTTHTYRVSRSFAPLLKLLADDRDVARNELRERLTAALLALPAIQREVVLLHDYEGWKHAEIAQRLGLSDLMSRRHLSDARKRLRDLLEDLSTMEPDHD